MRSELANILSFLDSFSLPNSEDIAKQMAEDFRNRRIEKNLTRKDMAEKSGVAVSNITRFEQKGLISLKNLIELAMALGYTAELKGVFSEAKFTTIAELDRIKKNTGRKKAYKTKRNDDEKI